MTGMALPTRFAMPVEASGDGTVPLEMVHYPLFSTFLYVAGTAPPRVAEVFNYLRGQNVASNGVAQIANQWHTNMLALKTVPRPKTFVVESIRMMLSPLTYPANAPALLPALTASTAQPVADSNVDDATLIQTTSAIRFRIGEKVYAEGPMWNFPANAGMGGVVAASVTQSTLATQGQQRSVQIHTAGLVYDLRPGKCPVLWNQQTFTFEIFNDFATPVIIGNRALIVSLQGILGREIQ